MTLTELSVSNNEQTIYLQDGYIAELRFDMIYKRWFYNLYKDDTLLYAGVSLTPDAKPLQNICNISLGIVDLSNDTEEYEPYSELGARLALMEIAE